VPKTASDVPETLLGHLNSNGTVTGGIKIPGLASWLSDPSTGKNTVVQGLNAWPPSQEPTIGEVNIVHLAWDVMIGIGTLLSLLAVWYAISWLFRRRMPMGRLFLLAATAAGVASIVALEAGWVVTEVGRQPWIVHNYLLVKDASTTNGGVWITFIVITLLYIAVGTTLVLVLRSMSRRWRGEGAGEVDETDVPYGPSAPPDQQPDREQVPVA
jgi:cytochrome d ubiquinol oxidase subunit I